MLPAFIRYGYRSWPGRYTAATRAPRSEADRDKVFYAYHPIRGSIGDAGRSIASGNLARLRPFFRLVGWAKWGIFVEIEGRRPLPPPFRETRPHSTPLHAQRDSTMRSHSDRRTVSRLTHWLIFAVVWGTVAGAADATRGQDPPKEKQPPAKAPAAKSAPAEAAAPPSGAAPGGPAPAATPPGKPGQVPFADLMKDAKPIEGLIRLYRKDDRLLADFTPNLLDRDFIILISIARGIGESAAFGRNDLGLAATTGSGSSARSRTRSRSCGATSASPPPRGARRKRPCTWPTPTACCSACR